MNVDEVKSKEDFILLLMQIKKDFEEKNQDWESQDLSSYFESMIAWVEDTDNSNLEGNVWAVMSKLLVAPKYHE
ncbi:DUF7660 family protein [Pontibacillus salipaludis]|uniref:DUF7660 family protein n=1 Tax=Pontibacillus salipaludis TaxID=1697394 RepID=UPI0031F03AB6